MLQKGAQLQTPEMLSNICQPTLTQFKSHDSVDAHALLTNGAGYLPTRHTCLYCEKEGYLRTLSPPRSMFFSEIIGKGGGNDDALPRGKSGDGFNHQCDYLRKKTENDLDHHCDPQRNNPDSDHDSTTRGY